MNLLKTLYLFIKRLLDIIISIIGLIPLTIVFAFVLLFKLFEKDYGKIIYIQERVGKNGKLFKMYKFRTMRIDAEESLTKILEDENNKKEWMKFQKLKNDSRIIGVGKFLRKHSLDELPQFVNTLLGDMSVIGPRPLVKGELESHNGDVIIYNSIKPGITGWWTCNGRSKITYDERLSLEYYYIDNFSFRLDFICFFKTIRIMFTGEDSK